MKLRCKEFFKQITFSAKIMHKANGMTFFLYILLRLCIATLPLLELYYFNELIDLLAKEPATLLLVPFFCIFLSYCAKQMGFLYLPLGICCSLFTLLIPIVFRKINLKYEKENWNYKNMENKICGTFTFIA